MGLTNNLGKLSSIITSTGSAVGIGTTSTGFNVAGLPLVVGSGIGNTGMTIFSGNASSGSIHFADTVTTGDGSFAGFINYTHPSNDMRFGTDSTERMRITSAGNVGIGTSSPGNFSGVTFGGAFLDVAGLIQVKGTSGNTVAPIQFGGDTYRKALIYTSVGTDDPYFAIGVATSGSSSSSVERMRITSGGNLLVGTTDAAINSGVGIKLLNDTSRHISSVSSYTLNTEGEAFIMYSTGAGNYRFYVGWGGQIYATSTTISGISDMRLKENIRDINCGLKEIMLLKPREFDWKEGKGKNIKNDRGFIAQEFEEIFPDLIDISKDKVEEGESPYKAIRQDLIPVLVKAMQEMNTKLDEQNQDFKSRLDKAGL